MTDMREGSTRHDGAAGSLGSVRITRKALLLGGYVVAGWVGLCAFGGHHAAQASTVDTVGAPTAAHAGLLGAVTASAHSGPTAAEAAPSSVAHALPQLSDLAPVRNVIEMPAISAPTGRPAPQGAGPSSSTPTVGNVADISHAVKTVGISKPVEETLTAVTAPVRSIHTGVVDPITKTTVPPAVRDVVHKVTDTSALDTGVIDTGELVGTGGNAATAPIPVTSTEPAPSDLSPTTANPAPATQPAPAADRAGQATSPAAREHATATPVPALGPATTPRIRYGIAAASFADTHPSDASQTPRGSLRSGAGAPTAPPQNPGPLPALPGGFTIAGASVTTTQLGSGFSGSALLADQMISARSRAVHTVQHDNARIARAEAAQPSCSPD